LRKLPRSQGLIPETAAANNPLLTNPRSCKEGVPVYAQLFDRDTRAGDDFCFESWRPAGRHIRRVTVDHNHSGRSHIFGDIEVDTQILHHSSTYQVTCCPQTFSWSWSACGAVNQTDEVEIIRHTRQLAADSLQGEKESAVEHGSKNELEAPCLKITFQRLVSSVLTDCLSSGDNPRVTGHASLPGK
jgi:hypothetical protein